MAETVEIDTRKSELINYSNYETFKVFIMNDIVELTGYKRIVNPNSFIQRIDNNCYLYKTTGEIRKYNYNNTTKNKSKSELYSAKVKNYRRSMRNVIRHIYNNFNGGCNEFFATLTYATPVNSAKQLYKDFSRFIDKLKRRYKNTEYIAIPELTRKGDWHIHFIAKNLDLETFRIDELKLTNLWGHGFAFSERIYDIHGLGVYLTQKRIMDYDGDNDTPNDKLINLWLYPDGMNKYRKSAGILTPEPVEMNSEQIENLIGDFKPQYSVIKTITDTETEMTLNEYAYQQFIICQ